VSHLPQSGRRTVIARPVDPDFGLAEYLALILGLVAGRSRLSGTSGPEPAFFCSRTGSRPNKCVEWYLVMILMTLVPNLDEQGLVAANTLSWMMYVLACSGLANASRQARLKRRYAQFDKSQDSASFAKNEILGID
jgi:hypothetical protein